MVATRSSINPFQTLIDLTQTIYICSARIPNLSGYVSGCPLRNGVTRCVTGRPDAQLQIHDNRLHNGAVPLRNRASSRLFRYATGQDRGCPVAQPGNMWLSRYATGQHKAVPLSNRTRSKPSHCATGVQLRLFCCLTSTSKLSCTVSQCCLLYTSPSPRDATLSRMPSSA